MHVDNQKQAINMNKDRLSYQNDQINVTEAFCGSLGQNLFLSMGYVSVIFLLLELAAVLVIKETWCYFIWVGGSRPVSSC
jgi:hypothetical protein